MGRIALSFIFAIMILILNVGIANSAMKGELRETSRKISIVNNSYQYPLNNMIVIKEEKEEEINIEVKKETEMEVAIPSIQEAKKTTEKYPNVKFETFQLTAYTAGVESTGKTPNHPLYGVTASGNKVKENFTIACPKSMKFGTKVYIPYFDNVFVCEDRGGAITEGKIDVYMPDLDKALEFGRQSLKVKIIGEEY